MPCRPLRQISSSVLPRISHAACVSAVCALVVRFSADLLKPSTPIAATVGPAAVLALYAAILFVTGYYRTLAETRREWGSIPVA